MWTSGKGQDLVSRGLTPPDCGALSGCGRGDDLCRPATWFKQNSQCSYSPQTPPFAPRRAADSRRGHVEV